MKADLIVVGAGPAGAAAALQAARAGLQVLLLERTRFPREKACGDGLTPRATDALKRLGISVEPTPAVRKVVMRSPADLDRPVTLPFETGCGTVLPRFDLDERIARAAVESGATLQTSSVVESLLVENGRVLGVGRRTPGGRTERLRAPIVLLAEGSAGGLLRQAPLPAVRGRSICFAVRRYLENVDWNEGDAFEIWLPLVDERGPLVGYGWAFPLPDGRANVGLGLLAPSNGRAHLRETFDAFERALVKGDPRFARARPCGRLAGAPIRLGACGAASCGPGMLVVGDAAGLAHPLWAEGISGALESGALAARAAAANLDHSAPVSNYVRDLRRRAPTIDRLASSVPRLYSFYSHVAWDVPGLCGAGTRLSQALFRTANPEVPHPGVTVAPGAELLADHPAWARSVTQRALALAGRDRPFFGGLVEELDQAEDVPSPVALATTAAYFQAGSTGGVSDSVLRRATVCLELLRWALSVVGELGPEGPSAETPAGVRGAGWLSSTLALSLADRLLARSFALAARLPAPARHIVAQAHLEAAEAHSGCIAIDARTRDGDSDEEIQLVGLAARAGALLAGADTVHAASLERAAIEAAAGPPHSFVNRFEVSARRRLGSDDQRRQERGETKR